MLSRFECAVGWIEVEEDQCGSLFLKRVEPSAIWMKNEVARTIPGRDGYVCYGIELTGLLVQPPNVNGVRSEIAAEHKFARRVGFDHVRVRAVVTADGEASWRGACGAYGPGRLSIGLHICRGLKAAIGQEGQYREASPVVIRYQNMFA